jgi:hypothetical protein
MKPLIASSMEFFTDWTSAPSTKARDLIASDPDAQYELNMSCEIDIMIMQMSRKINS